MIQYENSANEEYVKVLAAVAIFIAWILFVLYLRRYVAIARPRALNKVNIAKQCKSTKARN